MNRGLILIADSGSTKTDWLLLDGDNEGRMFRTSGINPYFLSKEKITEVVQESNELIGLAAQVKTLHFYGAGCTERLQIDQVEAAMKVIFTNSEVQVLTDMVGAARAVLGNREGIAAILGTGSNSCTYDGSNLVNSVPSLGYILMDEGSGSYIGRLFVKALLFGELSDEVKEAFDKEFNLSQADIITATLSKPMPNRFLASFCVFIAGFLQEEAVNEIAKKAFRDFMKVSISNYDDYQSLPLGFVGSIAYYFQEPLKEVVTEFGIEDVSILKSPIEALGKYHQGM